MKIKDEKKLIETGDVADYIEYFSKNKKVSEKVENKIIKNICLFSYVSDIYRMLELSQEFNLSKKSIDMLLNKIVESKTAYFIAEAFNLEFLDNDQLGRLYEAVFFMKNIKDIEIIMEKIDRNDGTLTSIISNNVANYGSKNIFNFILSYHDKLKMKDINLLLDKLYESHDYSYIVKIAKLEIGASFNILPTIIKLNDDHLICNYAVNNNNLTKDNIELIVNYFKNKKNVSYNSIIRFIKNVEGISSEDVLELSNRVINESDIPVMMKLSNNEESKNPISSESINKIAEKINNSNNINNIFMFLLDNKDIIDRELFDKMVTKIIISRDKRLLCLTALYIDNSIIYSIFKGICKLSAYTLLVDFTDEERNVINNDIINLLNMGINPVEAEKEIDSNVKKYENRK